MKFYLCFLAILSSLCLISVSAQIPQAVPTPPDVVESNDNNVVVIKTNLIQIDATVTDKKGNIVTDLTVDDFEIYENGKLQPITNFSFMNLQAKVDSLPEKQDKRSQSSLPLPSIPSTLRPEQVRRTMALIVDDLGLSFASTKFVKEALRKFVDEQMQPGDLVAIVRTGGGAGSLQQFTSDKRILHAAIDKLRFNVNGRVGVSSFEPIQANMKEDLDASMSATGDSNGVSGGAADRAFDIGVNQFREDVFAVGTLGAINYIVGGMRGLPGRKAVTLFSEGFSLMQREASGSGRGSLINVRIEAAVKKLVNLANQSSVVVYAVDPRGLVAPGFVAEDYVVGFRNNIMAFESEKRNREQELLDTQHGLRYLSQATGGFAFVNQNDISKGISKVLNDQNGYYLIGYQPNSETFDPAKSKFNKLEIKVKRPDLNVRYRSGFFNQDVSQVRTLPKKNADTFLEHLLSPFAGGEINLNLTTFFVNSTKEGSFMRSLIHIKGGDLKFVQDDKGRQKASFEVLAVTFGEDGEVIDTVNRVVNINAQDDGFKEIQEKGLVYSMTVPVKNPGAYQLRVALRDSATAYFGSASEFIDVPNLKKKRLALSGLVLESSVTREKRAKGINSIIQSDTTRDIAVRRFSKNSTVYFGTSVYNAKFNKSQLVTQYRLFHSNREIFISPESSINTEGQNADENVSIGGSFEIGKNMAPGEYILQVVVKDSLTNSRKNFASQWIAFEVF